MSLALNASALAVLSTVLPLTPPSHAQQASPTTQTLHLETRLVSLALSVADLHGAPVRNLTASDFALTEDGHAQPIAFFDSASNTPLDIVLAIDTSESVAPYEHLEREAARTFLHSLLRPQDRIALITFSGKVNEQIAFTNNSRRIDRALDHLKHGTTTALYDAIALASHALSQTPSPANARRVLVLLTDGEDTTHHGTYATALEAAQRAGVLIDSLILIPVAADAGRNTGGEHALMQLSTDTGGKFYDIQQQSDLAPVFAHVSTDLRTQYDLGYYAPQPNAAQQGRTPLHHIHLQLTNPALRAQYTLRYRTAY
jgi:Ca-activated chloride channel family protein